MGTQIVHDDALSGRQDGTQHRLDLGAQDRRVSDAVDGHHCLKALAPDGAQHGAVRPVVLGPMAYARSPWGARPYRRVKASLTPDALTHCRRRPSRDASRWP